MGQVNTVIGGVPRVLDRPFASQVVSASKSLTLDDHGIFQDIATDTLVMSLPAVGELTAPSGTLLLFRNTGANGNNIITVSPAAADAIFGTIPMAAADFSASGVVDKDVINTKATAKKGDWIALMSDGSTGWYIVGGVGVWASEA